MEDDEGLFETYTGTTITKTLVWMLRYFGIEAKVQDGVGRIAIVKPIAILDVLQKMKNKHWTADELLPFVEVNELFQLKYTEHIGPHLHVKMHIANEIDIKEAIDYLKRFEFTCIKVG